MSGYTGDRIHTDMQGYARIYKDVSVLRGPWRSIGLRKPVACARGKCWICNEFVRGARIVE